MMSVVKCPVFHPISFTHSAHNIDTNEHLEVIFTVSTTGDVHHAPTNNNSLVIVSVHCRMK